VAAGVWGAGARSAESSFSASTDLDATGCTGATSIVKI
jgi:hypothetical protein